MFNAASYNPDVLTCLANLSSDEVFTPPKLVNEILDLLPAELWQDKTATFLDPCSKSGVFLREITKRLMAGLEQEIPDRQTRINHILTKQVFGIAITELTAHLSRRSLYCSKHANGKYSICDAFSTEQGNLRIDRTEHTWMYGRCIYCGANQEMYERGEELETHAYQFIHKAIPEDFLKMKFDVIIGNPPYQLDTGGAGRQATPLYNKFVQKAKKLNPRFLTMIIPSRWFSGGMGLDEFRKSMLEDNHIKYIVDYSNSKDCFPQNSISGGVCYFLWERDYDGFCQFSSVHDGNTKTMERNLNEFQVLIRYNEAVEIIRKVIQKNEEFVSTITSSLTPFGLPTNFRGEKKFSKVNNLLLHSSEGISYISNQVLTKGQSYVNKYKVLVSKTGSEHAGEPDKDGKYKVFSSSIKVLGLNEVCTHSYFLIGEFEDIQLAKNLLIYLKTKFVRFLILQSMSSINLSKNVFQFVPIQDFSKPWTDEELYTKYELTEEEIAFIESMIRPMDLTNGDEDA